MILLAWVVARVWPVFWWPNTLQVAVVWESQLFDTPREQMAPNLTRLAHFKSAKRVMPRYAKLHDIHPVLWPAANTGSWCLSWAKNVAKMLIDPWIEWDIVVPSFQTTQWQHALGSLTVVVDLTLTSCTLRYWVSPLSRGALGEEKTSLKKHETHSGYMESGNLYKNHETLTQASYHFQAVSKGQCQRFTFCSRHHTHKFITVVQVMMCLKFFTTPGFVPLVIQK